MSKTTFFATLFIMALTGCAAAPSTEDTQTESSEDALRIGTSGGARLGYSCSGLLCTCRGDVDCNDMFGDGVCGDITSCDDTDPLEPVCSCIRGLGAVRMR